MVTARIRAARLIRAIAFVCIGGAALIQLARPERTNPPTEASRTMTAILQVPPQVAGVLDRGCRDCHSHDTRWPWYSNVAPVSWFVIDHVNHGRRHFNYSDWAQYDKDQVPRLLKDSCALARKEEMPMSSYLWLHPEARLSDRDIAALCDWTDAELRALPIAASR